MSCTCVDFRINGLNTCKHLEAVLLHLEETEPLALAAARAEGSTRIDLVPDVSRQTLRVERGLPRLPARYRSAFDADGFLRDPAQAPRLVVELTQSSPGEIRLSQDVAPWLDSRRRTAERLRLRREYEQKVQAGTYPLSETSVPLFPYQREGMLHLAFTERALLADEMGLGKTIQAIAACALLQRLGQVRRVLVVTPASLKAEWEEQIRRFTSLPCLIVDGTRAARLGAYDHPAFFTLVNYEQARADVHEINAKIRADVVILDEAQRIKAWNSLTAQAIKRLKSRYAFVLTGTPIENRIDELYSIVDFLDPTILGPLFRFNREYYELDERGRPSAYRNLDKLRAVLAPIMLRRRKVEVENELPSREDRHHYVGLSDAQRRAYAGHEQQVAALLATSQRRALLPPEQEKLLRELSILRMICDTPYILTGSDEDRQECPKLRELDAVLASALAEEGVKVIIFSEWLRMIELVRELLERRRIGFALHTGTINQAARRTEVQRFKSDPQCRVFLCTETGGVGLNLQNASVVINCDLPWNSAKYEQRIARAWRKHQTRPVSVINLIAEGTLEHRMLGTLAVKQNLADGVLDGGETATSRITLRGGGARLIERVQQLLAPPPGASRPASDAPRDPARAWAQRARQVLGERLRRCEERFAPATGRRVIFAVVDGDAQAVRARLEELTLGASAGAGERPLIEVVDTATAETLARLRAAGVIADAGRTLRSLLEPDAVDPELSSEERTRLHGHLDQVAKQLKLARLLATDTAAFSEETRVATSAAIVALARALATRHRVAEPEEDDGPLPPWITAYLGPSQTVFEAFAQKKERPHPALWDAIADLTQSLRSSLR